MRLQFHAPSVYFMHIPRTAGTSLRQFLRLVYPENRILMLGMPSEFKKYTLDELKDFDCYDCHFGPDLYKLIGRPALPVITILRDPVERYISTLYFRQWHVKNYPHFFEREYVEFMNPFLDADLRTLLSVPEIANLGRDEQTRTLGLGGMWNLRSFLKDGSNKRDKFLLNAFKLPVPTEKQKMNQILNNARAQLDNMAVVGITERFDEALELVGDLLGVPPRLFQVNVGVKKAAVNKHGYRSKLPPDLIEQVEELTASDRELYAYAYELFEQQYARYRKQPRRTYSIAPRILKPVRRMALASLEGLQARYPSVTESAPVLRIRSLGRKIL